MRYILTAVFLLFNITFLLPADKSESNPVQYLPDDVSFVLYLNSFDEFFDEYTDSYFWKKFKQTSKGKDLDRTLNSIDASFLIIGLTLNDLLEIFSEQAVLGVWLQNNSLVKDYIYLIEKKKNKKLIKNILERLEYFAIANKIDLKKYDYSSFNIYNFANKVLLAENADFVLISNDINVLNKMISRIDNKVIEKHNLGDFRAIFKNQNMVFYVKKTDVSAGNSEELYYSFRFRDKPDLEVLYNDKESQYTNKFIFENDYFRMMPSSVNYILIGNKDVRDLIYPFFPLIGTNIYQFDKEYFDAYFSGINFQSDPQSVTAIEMDPKGRKILTITAKPGASTNSILINDRNYNSTYLNVKIYMQNKEYYAFIKDKMLSSEDFDFLKKAVYAYKKNKGFYHTKEFKKISGNKSRNPLLWMSLGKYLSEKSLYHKEEKWLYYNAYIKTFKNFIIYSDVLKNQFYLKLTFY